MTVFGYSTGTGFLALAGKQVIPVDHEAEVSQRLLEASNSGDLKSALECLADPLVDVNYIGAVGLKVRKTEVVCCGESAVEVRVVFDEFKTDVTPLFAAVNSGNVALVKKLLKVGADINQTLFRGFSTTAAVREGHLEILEILLKAGASQLACEEALLEASCHGYATSAELLMGSDLIRPHVALHALVTACCRGFVDVVEALMKSGVKPNATARVLLRSSKPSLHLNIDCTPLVAAVVSRQISVVRSLLQAGVRTDVNVQLGAWSWDMVSGEELRVGAGLAEPYPITWLAVEYFEASGTILAMLLRHVSPSLNAQHNGRTLLDHAVLCGNAGAVRVLLDSGARIECPIKTSRNSEVRPLHMAARLGSANVLQCLIDFGCDINATTDNGDTALMICIKHKQEGCLKVLAKAGADFGIVNNAGQSASTLAGAKRWHLNFQKALLDVIRVGCILESTKTSVFSPLMFVAHSGDLQALKALIGQGKINLDYQDDQGFSAVMLTALGGHVEAFRILVYAGADLKLSNNSGETAITLSKLSPYCYLFEKVMLEFALEKGNYHRKCFNALHYAARHGDLSAAKLLTGRGYDVNVTNEDGYTPLMLAAREGHAHMCELLISRGAQCDIKNAKGETALSLAKKASGNVESVILDQLSRELVLSGANVWKHTKEGRGCPHKKVVKMLRTQGVLRWGNSRTRNVICREAVVGPSDNFQRLRQRKGDDTSENGLFRVITTKNKEVHFVCEGGVEMAKMWVRGIKLVTREAISNK